MIIYHITERASWQNAQQTGQYTAASLTTEGFIHLSTQEQVAGSANRHYHGKTGLVLLVVDSERVTAELRYEPVRLPSGETRFPHIYGPLNLDAVVDVLPFEAGPDGVFAFPQS